MEERELSYIDYINVQTLIVDWFNSVLPTLDMFPVDYLYTQRLPVLDAELTNALAILFTPNAITTMTDFVGDFNKLSFMLQFKTVTMNSDDHLEAIKLLQYLMVVLKDANMSLGNDKIILGLKGTLMPSMELYIETENASVYSCMFELEYKQKRRF